MSHFSVLVASRSENEVESLLAPYQENNMDTCPLEFLEFEDHTEEIEKEYEDYEFTNDFDDISQMALELYGYERVSGGRYGCWYNPDAKWDWYQLGGRWGGLPLKSGGETVSARKSEIDFSMNEEVYTESKRFWELYVEEDEPKTEAEFDIVDSGFYKKEYYTETFRDKETYAKAMASFNAYAFVSPDGEWFAQGEMGWFGSSRESVDEALAHQLSFYEKFIEDLDDDIVLTLVDCHI